MPETRITTIDSQCRWVAIRIKCESVLSCTRSLSLSKEIVCYPVKTRIFDSLSFLGVCSFGVWAQMASKRSSRACTPIKPSPHTPRCCALRPNFVGARKEDWFRGTFGRHRVAHRFGPRCVNEEEGMRKEVR